ncbi:hypothetical protein [Streptomyces sp. NBC_01353]|nr:hypothetical protein [Streptomyces sp. NBC_01353]
MSRSAVPAADRGLGPGPEQVETSMSCWFSRRRSGTARWMVSGWI